MGRKRGARVEKALGNFSAGEAAGDTTTYKCLVEGCGATVKDPTTGVPNLIAHLKVKHPAIFNALPEKETYKKRPREEPATQPSMTIADADAEIAELFARRLWAFSDIEDDFFKTKTSLTRKTLPLKIAELAKQHLTQFGEACQNLPMTVMIDSGTNEQTRTLNVVVVCQGRSRVVAAARRVLNNDLRLLHEIYTRLVEHHSSSAAVERSFSKHKLIHTSLRNSLGEDAVETQLSLNSCLSNGREAMEMTKRHPTHQQAEKVLEWCFPHWVHETGRNTKLKVGDIVYVFFIDEKYRLVPYRAKLLEQESDVTWTVRWHKDDGKQRFNAKVDPWIWQNEMKQIKGTE